jgi:NhaD family Na+/H+ antiporter
MLTLILLVFVLGYIAIALEHPLRLNKAATALITGCGCWIIYIIFSDDRENVAGSLTHHLGNLSQILFFLTGAMTIVELIDAHDGFELITKRITTTNKRKLIWIISFLAFILSAVLDNLTTSIIMITLVRKLMADKKDRLLFAGAVVIAANAGGAWSPIGDVTTTMLWIGGQVSASNIIIKLFVPGLVCMLVPLLVLNFKLKGTVSSPVEKAEEAEAPNNLHRNIVFYSGVGVFLLVPVLKTVFHIPPFIGILLGLGLLWLIVELLHSGKDEAERKHYTVGYALRKIDTPSILFFLGILLAVAALESTGQLAGLAKLMDAKIKNQSLIAMMIGLFSSVVDNVPLVAATMGMYDLQHYPKDHFLWEFLAYCTGTGGSILIIGSAAGVAAMGIEKIDFIWYLKHISWLALLGYLAGALMYLLMQGLL